jgi:hypothetical protein
MNNHTVLGEGRNDAYFMRKSIKKCNDDWDVFRVIAEDLQDQTITPGEEEEKLREFVYEHDYRYCVKSEGGGDGNESGLPPIFAYVCEKLVTGVISVTLVADLDGDPVSDLVDELQRKLDASYYGDVEWAVREHRYTVGDLKTWEATVENTSYDARETFYLVTFDNDLEAAVGISSDDPPRERFPEIREYASRREVREAFVDLYC